MVEIKITGSTPLEALSSLAAFGLHCMSDHEVSQAAGRILEAEKRQEKKLAAPAGTQNGAAKPQQATPVEEPVPDTPKNAPVPTAEQVRAKGIEASRKYGKEAVVAILQKFGVSGMSAITEKDRAAFLAELEALGAGHA